MSPELHFLRPLWLLALPALLALWIWLGRSRLQDRVWRPVVDPQLLPHLMVGAASVSRRLPLLLLGLGWLLAVIALAGPVWQKLPAPVYTLDTQRVILLDLSPSMNAVDLPPSRLARARFEVLDLLAAGREGQVALIAYGPEPFVVSPLTGDARTIAEQVPRLASDLIPVPGPRRVDLALQAAGELLDQAGSGPGEVILIADGLSDEGRRGTADRARALAAARGLRGAGHRVSVLAVGTSDGAPVPGEAGGFASDSVGAIQLSRLDRESLEELARAGGGRAVGLDAGDQDTRALIGSSPGMAAGAPLREGRAADQWREEGPWLLVALLPLAALGFRRGWLLPLVALATVLPPAPGWALGWDALWQRADQRGARSLAAGDPVAAAAVFEDPAWRAAARYRAGDYAGALRDLEPLSGPEADYNRGNALARLGRLDAAMAAYERALELDPDLEDAQANLELLRRLKAQQRGQQSGGREASDPEGQSPGDQDQAPDGQGPQGGAQPPGSGDGGGEEGAQGQGLGEAGGGDRQPGSRPTPKGDDQARDGVAPGGLGPVAEPTAGDLSPESIGGGPKSEPESERKLGQGPQGGALGRTPEDRAQEDRGPGVETQGPGNGGANLTPQERERRQALEAQLRRVPDDPAGLLRQRFILQHLRREGRSP